MVLQSERKDSCFRHHTSSPIPTVLCHFYEGEEGKRKSPSGIQYYHNSVVKPEAFGVLYPKAWIVGRLSIRSEQGSKPTSWLRNTVFLPQRAQLRNFKLSTLDHKFCLVCCASILLSIANYAMPEVPLPNSPRSLIHSIAPFGQPRTPPNKTYNDRQPSQNPLRSDQLISSSSYQNAACEYIAQRPLFLVNLRRRWATGTPRRGTTLERPDARLCQNYG